MNRVSVSPNISLYPSLAAAPDGSLCCAWYEYTSPTHPDRSDIWFSRTRDGKNWSAPVNVSGEVSYNNGPSLIVRGDGSYVLAWHSWRLPGTAPFSPDGGRRHIWVSVSKDGLNWSTPRMALPVGTGSEYAALVEGNNGMLWMLSRRSETGVLQLSASSDAVEWSEPEMLDFGDLQVASADIAVKPNGDRMLALTKSGSSSEIILAEVKEHGQCTVHRDIALDVEGSLGRPKIAIDSQGRMYLTCHSHTWGARHAHYGVEADKGQIKIEVHGDGSGGNACWALNAIRLQSPAGEHSRLYNFGPRIGDAESNELEIDASTALNDSQGEISINGPVDCISRQLGDRLTRTNWYCSAPRCITLRVPNGYYKLEIIYSSWVASTPGARIVLEPEPVEQRQDVYAPEHCFVARVEQEQDVVFIRVPSTREPQRDNNRPSRVAWCEVTQSGWLAWTRFTDSGVDIVVAPLDELTTPVDV